jgi:branched-chain amino acid transport system substrate-binding protein
MPMISRRLFLQSAVGAACFPLMATAAKAADAPSVTGTEIKIGQTMPYSGPASAFGVIGRTEVAYFKMVNDQGGISGRKINLISLDDAYSPANTVEQVRRLVEHEQVALIFGSLGTPTNIAVRQYLNDNRTPQLFVASGASVFADPQHFPWTMGVLPSYQTEARIYAKHILATRPDAAIAVLYQNDGLGKDYLLGVKDVLGPDRAGNVKAASYEVSEPTVDSQVIALQGSGADIFLIAATPKFAAQAIRKCSDIGWNPARYLSYVSASIASTLKPAGLDKSKGLITTAFAIDPTDSRYKDDPGMIAWKQFTSGYMSPAEFAEPNAVTGIFSAATMVQTLKQCGDDLSRENIMRQAANMKNFHAPMLLPGVNIDTSADQFRPIRQLQLRRFDGERWDLLGDVVSD